MITTNDIQALIALAISNNKQGLIRAMNNIGYSISQNISDADLFTVSNNFYIQKGFDALKNLFSNVPFDKSQLSQMQLQNLASRYASANPNAKNPSWFTDALTNFSDFLSGHTNVVQPTVDSNTTISSPISAKTIIILASFGIIAIVIIAIIFRNRAS